MSLRAFPYQPVHRDGFNLVRSRVYRGGDPIRDEEDLVAADCSATVVEWNGQIVGASTSIHYDCTFGKTSLKSAGVAAVGVLPEARRLGAGTELMRATNRQMRDEGFAMALLYPYSASFYRQFGYEYAGNRLTINCPRDRMPKIPDPLPAREIALGDAAKLWPCYNSFAELYPGMNRRNDLQWTRALGGDKPFQIFAVGDPVEAYVLVRLEWTFWVEQVVREFVWSTPRGYRSILSFLKGLGANKSSIAWNEPSHSPWLAQYGERDVQVTANQQIMWRVLNVEDALKTLRSPSDVEFTIEIEDPDFEENRGPWRVGASAKGSEVVRTDYSEVRVQAPALAQALLGEPSFESLVKFGQVDSHSTDALHRATMAFGSASAFCLEYF